jgi:hypothetical protein
VLRKERNGKKEPLVGLFVLRKEELLLSLLCKARTERANEALLCEALPSGKERKRPNSPKGREERERETNRATSGLFLCYAPVPEGKEGESSKGPSLPAKPANEGLERSSLLYFNV